MEALCPPKFPSRSPLILTGCDRTSQSLYCLMSCEDHLRSREKQWASKVTGTAVLCTATYAKGAKKPATRAWPLPSRQWLVPKLLRLLLMFLVSKAYYLPGVSRHVVAGKTAVLLWFGRSVTSILTRGEVMPIALVLVLSGKNSRRRPCVSALIFATKTVYYHLPASFFSSYCRATEIVTYVWFMSYSTCWSCHRT